RRRGRHRHGSASVLEQPATMQQRSREEVAEFSGEPSYFNSQKCLEQESKDQRQHKKQPNPIPFDPCEQDRTLRIVDLNRLKCAVCRQSRFTRKENALPPAIAEPNGRNASDTL